MMNLQLKVKPGGEVPVSGASYVQSALESPLQHSEHTNTPTGEKPGLMSLKPQ